jgi:hypothetical protein
MTKDEGRRTSERRIRGSGRKKQVNPGRGCSRPMGRIWEGDSNHRGHREHRGLRKEDGDREQVKFMAAKLPLSRGSVLCVSPPR